MGSKQYFQGTLCLLFLMVTLILGTKAQGTIFDVKKFGAKGDGVTDDSQAIGRAWTAACASTTPSTVLISKGTFGSGPLTFQGPCKATPIGFNLQGTLLAPADPSKFASQDGWVVFHNVNWLIVSGGGTFDGQGALAWSQNDCAKTGKCNKLPINIRLNSLNNSVVQDITSLNSKLFHMHVLGCNNLSFQRLNVIAPPNSLNTDGIHIGRSFNVSITDTAIKTGDDCVSLGDGSQQVVVERVTCGPGHGISIGSLGKYPNEQPVVGITVRNCTLTGTDNGVRVKTWPASPNGVAKDMRFEGIFMNNVGNPVLIDQYYCPYNECQAQSPSRVQISNVVFKNIYGTSSTQSALKISCSPALPCQNVVISNVDLKYNALGVPTISECGNVKPTLFGNIYPPACAKKAHFP